MNQFKYEIPKYDTVEGITEYVKDLTGFNKLVTERREAGYDRKERLHDFIILGRWITDIVGNVSKIVNEDNYGIIPAQAMRCPPVMTKDEMFKTLHEDTTICSTSSSSVPPDYVKCSVCEKPWTIRDAHDCVSSNDTEVIDASMFVGALLSNIKKIPKYIDVVPHHVHHDSVRPKHLDKGSDRVEEDYIIQPGDKIFASVWDFKHEECNQLSIIQHGLKLMTKAINNTGMIVVCDNLVMFKNQYHSSYKEPWYRLKFVNSTGSHEITIGWRKRVINIDWSKSGKDLQHLFTEENVTKSAFNVHAYGYEKATGYLKKIISAL